MKPKTLCESRPYVFHIRLNGFIVTFRTKSEHCAVLYHVFIDIMLFYVFLGESD